MKKCSKCLIEQDLNCFYKDNNSADGVHSWCKKCKKISRQLWRLDPGNQKKDRVTAKRFRDNHPQDGKNRYRQKHQSDSTYFARLAKESRQRRGEDYLRYRREYDKHQRKTNPLYKIRRVCSNRIVSAIHRLGFKKQSTTAKMLGCEWLTLKEHLESKFQPGMTWDNYGEWEIDHITPCCSAATLEELEKLQHFTNLQPLWLEDHRQKTIKDIGQ